MLNKNALHKAISQEQIANKLKKEMTRSDKEVLELIFSLNLKYGNCSVGNRYIARRLNISEITVKRTLRKFRGLFFRRLRRFKPGEEITPVTTMLPEWSTLDNIKWLFKKFFPKLLKYPHFLKKFILKTGLIITPLLLSQMDQRLQGEMIYHNTSPLYIKLYSYSNSPRKRKSMLPPEKPDYIRKYPDRNDNRQPEPPRYSEYRSKPVARRNYREDQRLVSEFLNSTDEKYRIGQEFLMSLGMETVKKLVKNHMAPRGPIEENE